MSWLGKLLDRSPSPEHRLAEAERRALEPLA
jgi:hypothetical protein